MLDLPAFEFIGKSVFYALEYKIQGINKNDIDLKVTVESSRIISEDQIGS